MFVRKKKNKSGSISVQIISKANKKYKVVKTIGSSKDRREIEKLSIKAHHLIPVLIRQSAFDFLTSEEIYIEQFLETLSNAHIHIVGPELIFGTLFDRLGFNQIKDKLFRHLVVTRLVCPGSKLKTMDYLQRYKGVFVSSDKIYRFLDRLHYKYKDKVEKIAFEHTKKILKGKITVVFYDLTTLYFEAEDEDDLRKIGFSKDGKFQRPQIMLGLLVGKTGYPIGYDVFEGNIFEGHTLLPALKQIQKKYNFSQKPTIIADAALLSKDNLKLLKNDKYTFIVGARIKNETKKVKEKIFKAAKNLKNGESVKLKKADGTRLVISYSDKRAKKDQSNRERGIRKLKAQIKCGKITKKNLNNRGYSKFLTIKGKIKVVINENRIKADKNWDGLKGYITNTKLSAEKIVENYTHLWQIEKAFRISKTDLRIRPIYHRLKSRIEAHILIAFVAYTIYKELERLLYKHKLGLSVKRTAELTHNMYEMSYKLSNSAQEKSLCLKMDSKQQVLFDLIKNS